MSSNPPPWTANTAQFHPQNTQPVYVLAGQASPQPQTVYVTVPGPQQVQPPPQTQTQGVVTQMYSSGQPGGPSGAFSAQRQSMFLHGGQQMSSVGTSSMNPSYAPVQNQTASSHSSQLYGSHMSSYLGQPATLSSRSSPASTLPHHPSSTFTSISGLPITHTSIPPPIYPGSPAQSGTPLPLYPNNTGVSTTSSFTSPLPPSSAQFQSQQTTPVVSMQNPSQLRYAASSTPVSFGGGGAGGSAIRVDGYPSGSMTMGMGPSIAQGQVTTLEPVRGSTPPVVQNFEQTPAKLRKKSTMNSLISPTPPPPSASPIQVQPQVQNQFQPQLQPQLQYQQHAPPQQQQQQQQQQPGQFYVTPEGYLLPVPRAPAVVQQQPQPTMGMSIQPGGGGNRNSKNLPYDAQGLREWSFEIFECCGDSETCLAALFCPCIVHSANEKRIQYLETHGTYDPEHGGPWCSDNCWDYICKTGVAIFCGCCSGGLACCCRMPCLMQISPRQHVRARYNIVGTASTDCVGAVCCSSCALTQESRELELEEMSLGWTKPTPTTEVQMQPSAPMQTHMVTVPPTATMTMVVPQSTGQAGFVGNEKYVVQV